MLLSVPKLIDAKNFCILRDWIVRTFFIFAKFYYQHSHGICVFAQVFLTFDLNSDTNPESIVELIISSSSISFICSLNISMNLYKDIYAGINLISRKIKGFLPRFRCSKTLAAKLDSFSLILSPFVIGGRYFWHVIAAYLG